MLGPQHLLEDRQVALLEGLGLPVAALSLVDLRQVVEAGGGVGVLGPQHLLEDRQGALVEGLGFPVAALSPVDPRQVVEAGGGVGVLRPLGLLRDRQDLLPQRLRFRIGAPGRQGICMADQLLQLGIGLGGSGWRLGQQEPGSSLRLG